MISASIMLRTLNIFSTGGMKNNVIPKSLKIRSSIRTKDAIRYFQVTVSGQCLRFEIRERTYKIQSLRHKIN